jgi:predicted DNA-binding helix-hairpin-helix protein
MIRCPLKNKYLLRCFSSLEKDLWNFSVAVTRKIDPKLEFDALRKNDSLKVDINKAHQQHSAMVKALKSCNLSVVTLESNGYPVVDLIILD